MFKLKKIISLNRPQVFTSLNNGVWYYNFNIEQQEVTDPILNESFRYTYSQVRILGNPTINSCYKAVTEAYTDKNGNTLASVINSPAVTEEINQFAKEIYENIEIDFGKRVKPTELEIEKRKAIKVIDAYDVSIEVNSFFLNGLQVWLDKSTRVGLMNSLNIEKLSGKEISTLWFGNIKLEINTDAAIQMLSALELYALECYNKTAEHKVNIQNMNSVEEVVNYDFTEGYPDKLNFNV